jgi:hypothetical protein
MLLVAAYAFKHMCGLACGLAHLVILPEGAFKQGGLDVPLFFLELV